MDASFFGNLIFRTLSPFGFVESGGRYAFLLHQVVPSKMKLDDLIRTSLMVMAVARAGEQQSVIRCTVHCTSILKYSLDIS